MEPTDPPAPKRLNPLGVEGTPHSFVQWVFVETGLNMRLFTYWSVYFVILLSVFVVRAGLAVFCDTELVCSADGNALSFGLSPSAMFAICLLAAAALAALIARLYRQRKD